MKKSFYKLSSLIFVLFSSVNAWAHCPVEFKYQSEDYCLDLQWQTGDLRQQGVYLPSTELSPVLNKRSVRPELWIYSKAHIAIWSKGDKNHAPIYLQDFKAYPFMVMAGGHSHGARSNLVYDEDLGVYVLSQMSFQEMSDGCWQIRFKASDQGEEIILQNIEFFTNLNPTENYDQSVMCSLCQSVPTVTHDHSH